jgi:hypothetical protein
VIYDNGRQSKDDRVIICSTKKLMRVLAKNQAVAMDGTFLSCPQGWQQILGVHTSIDGRFVPVAIVYCANRTEDTYELILQKIAAWIHTVRGRVWQPESFYSDFEPALIGAVRTFWEGMKKILNKFTLKTFFT